MDGEELTEVILVIFIMLFGASGIIKTIATAMVLDSNFILLALIPNILICRYVWAKHKKYQEED